MARWQTQVERGLARWTQLSAAMPKRIQDADNARFGALQRDLELKQRDAYTEGKLLAGRQMVLVLRDFIALNPEMQMTFGRHR